MINKTIELKLTKILKKYNRECGDNFDILKQFYSEGLSGEPFNKVFREKMKLRMCEKQEAINEDFEKMCKQAYIIGNGKQTRLLECVKLAIEDRKMIVVDIKDKWGERDPEHDDGDNDNEEWNEAEKVFINQHRIYKNNLIEFKKDLEIFFNYD